jgi:PAS domain S-box-containing protein
MTVIAERGPRLLLIEDNPADSRLINEMLADAPGPVLALDVATTLAEGLDRLTSEAYDAVLLDLSLPDSVGIDTFRRTLEHAPTAPIIVLTGMDDEELAALAVRGGAQDYLVKGSVDGRGLARSVRYAIERAEVWTAVRASEARFRDLAESIRDIFFAVDRDMRCTYWNRAARDALGISAEEAHGRTALDLFSGLEGGRIESLMTVSAETGETRSFVESHPEWAPARHFEWSVHPTSQGLTVFVRDVTERMRDERELALYRTELERLVAERTAELSVANDQLIEANQQMAQATRMKSAFLAATSHDLRTPLNSILGFSEMLLQGMAGALTEEQGKQITLIQEAGRHLLVLINGLLDLSRVEAGREDVVVESVEARSVVAAVAATLQPLAAGKGIELNSFVPDGLVLRTDATKLRRILTNLLGNAIKFTERGSAALDVRADGDTVRFVVVDTGPGIAPERLGDIFEEFVQLQPRDAKREGTGLGLPISEHLAALLGGEITVESDFGHGATFTLVLPLDAYCTTSV